MGSNQHGLLGKIYWVQFDYDRLHNDGILDPFLDPFKKKDYTKGNNKYGQEILQWILDHIVLTNKY